MPSYAYPEELEAVELDALEDELEVVVDALEDELEVWVDVRAEK